MFVTAAAAAILALHLPVYKNKVLEKRVSQVSSVHWLLRHGVFPVRRLYWPSSVCLPLRAPGGLGVPWARPLEDVCGAAGARLSGRIDAPDQVNIVTW